MPPVRLLEADNDFDASITLTNSDGSPLTGLLNVIAFISETRQQTTATAIHSDLQVSLTETPASSGIYVGVIQGSAITERLCNAVPSYTNRRVYLMRKTGQDYHKPVTCRVRDGSVYG